MTATQTFVGTLVIETCCNCGIPFGITEEIRDRRLEDHESFYCPNGHGQRYTGKTEAQKLREELARQKQFKEWAEARAESYKDQAETAEARRRGQKAANTRLKKRIAAGVCPCCRRNFQDLHRHMASQHPDYAVPADSGSER